MEHVVSLDIHSGLSGRDIKCCVVGYDLWSSGTEQEVLCCWIYTLVLGEECVLLIFLE